MEPRLGKPLTTCTKASLGCEAKACHAQKNYYSPLHGHFNFSFQAFSRRISELVNLQRFGESEE